MPPPTLRARRPGQFLKMARTPFSPPTVPGLFFYFPAQTAFCQFFLDDLVERRFQDRPGFWGEGWVARPSHPAQGVPPNADPKIRDGQKVSGPEWRQTGRSAEGNKRQTPRSP